MRTNRPQKTSDYKLFEAAPDNRPLHDDPVLIASMKKHGFLPCFPIIVTRNGSKLRIVTGHHRFVAAERLGIPVWYLVVEGDLPDVFFLEGTRVKWSPEDFGRSRAPNNPAIAKVFSFSKKHGLTFTTSASLLGGESAGSGNHTKFIKEGTFTIAEDQAHTKAVIEITDRAHELGIPFAGSRAFVSAVSMAIQTAGFDAATFLHRLKIRPWQMMKRSRADEYLTEMEALYNFGARNPFPLKLEAMKASRTRKATFRRSVTSRQDKVVA
jgi:hypothetical protein